MFHMFKTEGASREISRIFVTNSSHLSPSIFYISIFLSAATLWHHFGVYIQNKGGVEDDFNKYQNVGLCGTNERSGEINLICFK